MAPEALLPFHIAIPVRDLVEARRFYGELLGCSEGRSSDVWVDFDFFGHQLVCHQHISDENGRMPRSHNPVDGENVPVPHFGAVLELDDWRELARRLQTEDTVFVIEPQIRFEGQVGEQATMFLLDPSGNAIEFKAFQNIREQLFASDENNYQ